MKKLVTLLFLISNICHAQNWQCLQYGVKHYFTNANGYLRGIRIDSVKTVGSDVVYYPFHTPRGSYDDTGYPIILDSNSGSWLGRQVIQQSDGTFIFDNYWNDSVLIKSRAHIGDNWILYSDTSGLYYTGTITSEDTMTVLTVLDSIKTITINARNPSGVVTSDPLNGFTLFLSKNNGFVQVCDLYCFPYHKPDSAYRAGLDFYLDRAICLPHEINSMPGAPSPSTGACLFKLVNFINPNEQQLHAWSIGDVIHSENILGNMMLGPTLTTKLSDTIVNKVVTGHVINYTVHGSSLTCPYPYTWYPCTPICQSGVYSFSSETYPIFDTLLMPEETTYIGRKYLFYYPYDSNYCSLSPAYTLIPNHFNYPLGWILSTTNYKLGIGKTYFQYFDGNPTWETNQLLYHNIGGTGCGTPIPSSTFDVENNKTLSIYPNPATNILTITGNGKITQLTITNLIGQAIYTSTPDSDKVEVNVSGIPSGIYLVRINDSIVRKFVKE